MVLTIRRQLLVRSSSYFTFVDGSITILDQDGFDYETLTVGHILLIFYICRW